MDSNAPSIFEMFNSAKKLLSLQKRVENRHLRKSCQQVQKRIFQENIASDFLYSSPSEVEIDILSPLSMEDFKSSNFPKNPSSTFGNKSNSHIITPVSVADDNSVSEAALSDDAGSIKIQSNTKNRLPRQIISSSLPTPNATPNSLQNQFSRRKNDSNSNILNINSTMSMTSPQQTTECSNCHTLKTPLWRKDPSGNTLCNACGLFQKLHGTMRPLSLKTDVIKKRNSRRVSISDKKLNGYKKIDDNIIISNSNSFNNSSVNSGYMNSNLNSNANNNAMTNRYKNVLILPKPSSLSRTNSIPIPSTNSPVPLSCVSSNNSNSSTPTGTPVEFYSSSSYGINPTQNYLKRQKSELNMNFEYLPINTNQYNDTNLKRVPPHYVNQSQSYTKKYFIKTNLTPPHSVNSSFSQASSFSNTNNSNLNISGNMSADNKANNIAMFNRVDESFYNNPNSISNSINAEDLDWLKFDL